MSLVDLKSYFPKKFNSDGSFLKYKCRIVFRGDRWKDYWHNKTYSGTVIADSVRLLFAIIAAEDMEFIKVDVGTAFLNADVPAGQVIQMYSPTGLPDTYLPPVIQLKKCLYGLPFAPAEFRRHRDNTLTSIGFQALQSDKRVYTKSYPEGKAFIMVHVDDFGIATPTIAIREDIISSLQKTYTLTYNETEYLGMTIVRDRANRTLTLTQTGQIDEMLEDFRISLTGSHPVTPMVESPRTEHSDNNKLLLKKGITDYQSRVGSLLYLATHTRPDILYAVNMASRQCKSPTEGDLDAVDRILNYLAGTRTLGLCFHAPSGVKLVATVDASYGTHTDRKSHTGITLHIGESSGSFLTRSKKQSITADSSTAAEYIAAHSAAKEIQWARSLLDELGYKQQEPTVLFEDNKSTITMVNNDSHSQKTKHIDIRYHYIREAVQRKQLVMEHLPTKEMTSDIATKPLGPTEFLRKRPLLLGMTAVINRDRYDQGWRYEILKKNSNFPSYIDEDLTTEGGSTLLAQ